MEGAVQNCPLLGGMQPFMTIIPYSFFYNPNKKNSAQQSLCLDWLSLGNFLTDNCGPMVFLLLYIYHD